jgi:DNA mismatch endonuclease (patch repair protein)
MRPRGCNDCSVAFTGRWIALNDRCRRKIRSKRRARVGVVVRRHDHAKAGLAKTLAQAPGAREQVHSNRCIRHPADSTPRTGQPESRGRTESCILRRMADGLPKETRSRITASIRSKDTKPEIALRRALWAAGIRGWRCHPKTVPGRPDIAFTKHRVAIFVDGRFWHGHPDYFTPGKSGPYWDAKIARTQERDRIANDRLCTLGWCVLRIWDFEVEEDVRGVVQRVLDARNARADPANPAASQPRCGRIVAAPRSPEN